MSYADSAEYEMDTFDKAMTVIALVGTLAFGINLILMLVVPGY